MTVAHLWSGAVTATTAKVAAKVTTSTASLLVANNAAMTSPATFGPVTASLNICIFNVTGLTADTQYWYQISGDTSLTGRLHTHATPGSQYSYTVAAAACAGLDTFFPVTGALAPSRISNHPVFDTIRDLDPLLFIHMGDRTYYNLGSGSFGITGGGSLANFRRADDDVLELATRQAALYRNVPTAWVWDDHDYGRNDDDGTNDGKANAAQVYRERVPSYPLALGSGPIYHSFQIGRVLWVVTDLRYNRDAPTAAAPRTMLGATQLAWLDGLLASPPAGSEALVWVSTQPTISNGATSWGSYSEERADIYQMFGDHGWLGKMCQIAGDQHLLGFDTGAHTVAGMPLFTLAALDSSNAGGNTNYDLGSRAAPGQYGTIQIADTGQRVRVTVRGWYT